MAGASTSPLLGMRRLRNQLQDTGIDVQSMEPEAWGRHDPDEFERKSACRGSIYRNEDVRPCVSSSTGLKAWRPMLSMLITDKDEEVFAFIRKALVATTDDSLSVDELVALVLETGKYGVQVMALLDKANTSAYGNPRITKVNIGVRNNPGILVSGHDLRDLKELLDQTKDTGMVSEMLGPLLSCC